MSSRLFFHSFNALRFFACFRIFLLHLPKPEGKQFFNTQIFDGGEIGVDLFFVLSGFLITYLLTYEYTQTGKINAKDYLLRRAFRIWPLYFSGVFIAYFNNFISAYFNLGSSTGYTPNLFFSLTFLENYQMLFHDNFPNGAPLRVFWSLCVEEHFYLLWLILFLVVPVKHFIKAAGVLWVFGILYRGWFYHQFPTKQYFDLDVFSKLDYFCAGGIAGYLIAIYGERVKQYLLRIQPAIRNGVTIAVIAFFIAHQYLQGVLNGLLFPVVSACLFAVLLLLIATSTTFLHFKESHIFSRLGKISFGFYVFHTVIIVTLMALAKKAAIDVFSTNLYYLFGVIAFLLTTLASWLSWNYFESFFLGYREKYIQKKRAVASTGTL
jgi:peptidoglycan/LPS O-acetylase OafA/YrhL